MRVITVNLPLVYIKKMQSSMCGDNNLFPSRSESIRVALHAFISQLVDHADFAEVMIKDWRNSFDTWFKSNNKKMHIVTINIPDDYVEIIEVMISNSLVNSRSDAARIAIHMFMQNEENFLDSMRAINIRGKFAQRSSQQSDLNDNQIRQIMHAKNIPIYSRGDTVYIKDNDSITVKTIKKKAEI